MILQFPGAHKAEGVVVGPGTDRREDLVGVGRGEDETNVLRGLFDQLQQRVEAGRGHHVRLVDDVDLVAGRGRCEHRAFTQITGVVHTAVACRIEFDHVYRSGSAGGQILAALADAARFGRGSLFAVQGPGHDARGGGLAAPARPGEQVGMVHTVVLEGTGERGCDVFLADHICQPGRPVGAIEGQ